MPHFAGALATILVLSFIIQAFRVWANEGRRRVLVWDIKEPPELEAETVRLRDELEAATREMGRLRSD
jgi:hypothetical protein